MKIIVLLALVVLLPLFVVALGLASLWLGIPAAAVVAVSLLAIPGAAVAATWNRGTSSTTST